MTSENGKTLGYAIFCIDHLEALYGIIETEDAAVALRKTLNEQQASVPNGCRFAVLPIKQLDVRFVEDVPDGEYKPPGYL